MKCRSARCSDQRRHRDRGQHRPDVDLRVHHHRAWRPCPGSPRAARAVPNHATQPRVRGRARRAAQDPRPVAPGSRAQPRLALLAASAPSRSPAPTTSAASPRRAPARGCAPDAWRRTARPSRRPRASANTAAGSRAGGVHHRDHVVHLLLERRRARDRIRQARAAAVEHDQPRERGHPLEVPRDRRLLPVVLDL